jgi:hypothetical protein
VSGGATLLFDMAQLLQYDVRLYVNSKYVQLSVALHATKADGRNTNILKIKKILFYVHIFSPVALRPNAGHDLLSLEVARSHTTTHDSR